MILPGLMFSLLPSLENVFNFHRPGPFISRIDPAGFNVRHILAAQLYQYHSSTRETDDLANRRKGLLRRK
jgi:hypothetical protein